jgi:hypothetical protein
MARSRLVRTIIIGSASAALAAGAGIAMMAPASAHHGQRPPIGAPQWGPFDDSIPTLCAQPGWAGGWGGSWRGSWDDDEWQIDWAVDPCIDPSGSAQADLEVALADTQAIFDDAIAQAKTTYNASIADELAAYREDRAGTKSQVARLLIWRGFVSATKDEQRVLQRATDAAKRDLALDQDAAYEIFDLETTDETVAAGRSDFRAARTAAEKSKTLALRAVAVTYEEAVDIVVLRLADSLSESGSTAGNARAWKSYRQGMAAARNGRASAGSEVQAQFQSAIDEAVSLLTPGDESYEYDSGIRPVPAPKEHHRGHGNGRGHDSDD